MKKSCPTMPDQTRQATAHTRNHTATTHCSEPAAPSLQSHFSPIPGKIYRRSPVGEPVYYSLRGCYGPFLIQSPLGVVSQDVCLASAIPHPFAYGQNNISLFISRLSKQPICKLPPISGKIRQFSRPFAQRRFCILFTPSLLRIRSYAKSLGRLLRQCHADRSHAAAIKSCSLLHSGTHSTAPAQFPDPNIPSSVKSTDYHIDIKSTPR